MHDNQRKAIFLSILILFFVSPLYSLPDNPIELLNLMRKRFPNDKAIYLSANREVQIDVIGDSIKVTSTYFYDMLHLDEQSNIFANDKIYSSHFAQAMDIDAKTLVPAKNKYKTIPVSSFTEKNEISEGIFYDDSKSISFIYPSVSPGARTSLKYKIKHLDPRFLNAFYFGSYLPVISSSLKIHVSKNIELDFKLMNCDSLKLDSHFEEQGKYNSYTWKATDINGLQHEGNAPNLSYYAPHIIYYVREANINGKAVPVLSEAKDLYKMYSSYIDGLNNLPDSGIKILVDSLTQNARSEAEKVEKIYYWVQDNIRYIAFEQGMRGLIPHEGSLVFKKRYGDCKDMASIIHCMLKTAGIKSYLTWIGSRDIPYRYTQIPTPHVDNHMIVAYENQGKLVFLDATSKFTCYGLPSSMIQGKEALIAIDKDNYRIATVPVVEKEINKLTDSIFVSINGNTLSGGGRMSAGGYHKVFISHRLSGLDKTSEKDEVTGIISKGSNKFFVDEYSINNLDDKNKDLIIDYNYRLEDYSQTLKDEIFINLNLEQPYANSYIDLKSRKLPIQNEFKYISVLTTVLQVPENFNVAYCPEDQEFSDENFGYSIAYEKCEDKIIQSKKIYINSLLLGTEQFGTWNSFIDGLNNAYRETIILKKGNQ